jgi:hypothetical protein
LLPERSNEASAWQNAGLMTGVFVLNITPFFQRIFVAARLSHCWTYAGF